MLRIPDDSGDRVVPGEVPGLRPQGREGAATAEQGAVQQHVSKTLWDWGVRVRRRVAKQFRLAESTVRGIDLRYLERWAASRRKPALRQMGVDEIHLGKKQKFLAVVCNLETGETLWFGRGRKKETLDEFFQTELSIGQQMRTTAACVDMWEPYRLSIEQHAPNCRIVYDTFHVLQHANRAVDEVRRRNSSARAAGSANW